MKSISWETADLMMKTAAFIYCKCFVEDDENPEVAAEEANDFARNVFMGVCDIEGIDEVEEPLEEEDKDGKDDYEDEEEEENPIVKAMREILDKYDYFAG